VGAWVRLVRYQSSFSWSVRTASAVGDRISACVSFSDVNCFSRAMFPAPARVFPRLRSSSGLRIPVRFSLARSWLRSDFRILPPGLHFSAARTDAPWFSFPAQATVRSRSASDFVSRCLLSIFVLSASCLATSFLLWR
jgi:hypothetical protein